MKPAAVAALSSPLPGNAVVYRARALSVRHPGGSLAALDRIDLTVARGEQVAIVGPSGAGKTTLLAALALARQPAGGELDLFGTAPWSLPSGARHAMRRRLFLAPQAPPLPPRQRVVTAVLAGKLPRWSLRHALVSLVRPTGAAEAAAALQRFDLQDKLYARVDRLSGGERQRVSLARLLLADAEVLLVDEPLSALDPRLARQTLGVLQDHASARHATLICSLHQIELAHAQFPRVVGMRDGRVQFDLPREAVNSALLAALYAGSTETENASNDEPARRTTERGNAICR